MTDGKMSGGGAPVRRRRRPTERGGRPVLTVERVVDAAIEVMRRDGLAATSMRAVAAELGVTQRSIYNYVDDRRTLLELMVLQIHEEFPVPVDTGDLRRDLRSWVGLVRQLFRSYPDLLDIGLVEGVAPTSERYFEVTEGAMRLLVDRGVSVRDAHLAIATLVRHAGAISVFVERLPDRVDVERLTAAAPVDAAAFGDRFPISVSLTPCSVDDYADFELDVLLDAIDDLAAAGGG